MHGPMITPGPRQPHELAMRHPALAAWTSEQLSERSLEHLKAGDFCIRCPNNDVTRQLDDRRIQRAA